MKIAIRTKNLELTPAIQDFIEEKFNSVSKVFGILQKNEEEFKKTLDEVFIELEKETRHHLKGDIFCVKSKIHLPGKTIIAEEKSDDLYKSIVACKDEMKMEVEKYKLKNIDKHRRPQMKESH
jgi:ribosomal subunit interface protein